MEDLEKFSLNRSGKSISDLNTREATRLIEILQEEPEEIDLAE